MIGTDGIPLTFATYVHALWCRAGAPPSRWLAQRAAVSHQTANALVRHGVAAKWSTVQPLLELLGADLDLAATLWAEAKRESTGVAGKTMTVPERLARLEAELVKVSERLDEVLRRLPGA